MYLYVEHGINFVYYSRLKLIDIFQKNVQYILVSYCRSKRNYINRLN